MAYGPDTYQRPEGATGKAEPEAVAVRALDRLPVLAPAEPSAAMSASPRATPEHTLRHDPANIHDESTDFRSRSEARDPIAALTVYAINAAVMLFAFPVGFALLVFNILGGENLRTTSHVMGLTGLAMALPLLGASVPFLS